MDEENKDSKDTELVPVEEMSLDEMQMAEQLYNSAGLDPVVDAGLKDHDLRIKQENKLINKVLGPRESDIRGYGEAVARRVAMAVYGLMNRQYGGKVGDLRENILALQDERDRANIRYDDLMGRVVGILGEEYRNLRSDSNMFMEKVTEILGDNAKNSKIDYTELAGRLADIDGLRDQVIHLTKEKAEMEQRHEAQLKEQQSEANAEIKEQKTGYEKAQENMKADYESKLEKQKQDYDAALEKEKSAHSAAFESQKLQYETQLAKQAEDNAAAVKALNAEHETTVNGLNAKIAAFEQQLSDLVAESKGKSAEIDALNAKYARLEKAVRKMVASVSVDEINAKIGEELQTFILEDSKVPDMVIDGVGKFIDFKKYFGLAAAKGAESALKDAESGLNKVLDEDK